MRLGEENAKDATNQPTSQQGIGKVKLELIVSTTSNQERRVEDDEELV